MNKIVEKAKLLNQFGSDIPELEMGDEVTLAEVWDGENDVPEDSYSYLLTRDGEDGNSNAEVWINYEFEIIEANNDEPLKSIVKIKDIFLI